MDLIRRELPSFRNRSDNSSWELLQTLSLHTFSNTKLTRRWVNRETRVVAFALPGPSCLVQLSRDAIQPFHSQPIRQTSRSALHRLLPLLTQMQTTYGSRIKQAASLLALIQLV